MKTTFVLVFLVFFLFPAATHAAPLSVAVSIPPQKRFIERIAGPEAAVAVIADKGRDPHTYEPTAAQMQKISQTGLYFAVGVPFETHWLPKFRSLSPAMRVVSLQEAVPVRKAGPALFPREGAPENGAAGSGHKSEHGHERESAGDDPHFWLSPKAVAATIPLMAQALSEARPQKAAFFQANAKILLQEVTDLDAALAAMFAALPAEKRKFLTFHQSWGYYAENYNLREISVELAGREPGPKSMAHLMDFATKNNIRVIVADPASNRASVAAIERGVKGKTIVANPLEENWAVSLLSFSRSLAKALGEKE